MNGEDIAKIEAAVGTVIANFKEDAFVPMRDDVKAIREMQVKIATAHGERLASLETEVRSKGNCTRNTADIKANEEKAEAASDAVKAVSVAAAANGKHISYLTISLLLASIGVLGTVIAWALKIV